MPDTILVEGADSFAHEVLDGLWIGNAPPIVSMHEGSRPRRPLAADFDTLVLCAREYQLAGELFSIPEVLHAPMDDAFEPVSQQLASVAMRVARKVIDRLADNKRVLVTCMAGRNRSGLVCALALRLGPPSLSADDAVAAVRAARGAHALANPFFVQFVHSL